MTQMVFALLELPNENFAAPNKAVDRSNEPGGYHSSSDTSSFPRGAGQIINGLELWSEEKS